MGEGGGGGIEWHNRVAHNSFSGSLSPLSVVLDSHNDSGPRTSQENV
jgi:hypothetical protein